MTLDLCRTLLNTHRRVVINSSGSSNSSRSPVRSNSGVSFCTVFPNLTRRWVGNGGFVMTLLVNMSVIRLCISETVGCSVALI